MVWRRKSLPAAEWAVLKDAVGRLQIALGVPCDLAMFMQGQLADPNHLIYITGPGIDAIEALSVGGWEDAETPSGSNIILLVGDGDPWAFFGIDKPI